MTRTQALTLLTLMMVTLGSATAAAAPIRYDVSLDTTTLVGSSAGPFSLSFQLVDGGGTATSSITLTDFTFGGGGPLGGSSLTGGASGDLASDITLTDAGPTFFTEFVQPFSAGSLLKFTILLTPGLESGGIPDQFSMGILTGSGTGIPTTFFDAFLVLDIDSRSPKAKTFASAPSSNVVIGPPTVSSVPEPGVLTLLGIGLIAASVRKRRARR